MDTDRIERIKQASRQTLEARLAELRELTFRSVLTVPMGQLADMVAERRAIVAELDYRTIEEQFNRFHQRHA